MHTRQTRKITCSVTCRPLIKVRLQVSGLWNDPLEEDQISTLDSLTYETYS